MRTAAEQIRSYYNENWMNTFVTSLALVLIAQIPLLLKLWLDYRSKTSGFKQELHRRQIDAFQPLLAQLTAVHEGLEMIVSTFADVTILNDTTRESASYFHSSTLRANIALGDMRRGADLLLPADLSIALHKYTRDTARIVTCAMGIQAAFDGAAVDIKALWPEQQVRFGISLNIMRLSVGTDALTSDVMREVHSGKQPMLIGRTDALDGPKFSLLNRSDSSAAHTPNVD
jgi:hypothetical protein